jgi:acyl-CoA synthetase (AMP-forming)/AMP-acid ligase II
MSRLIGRPEVPVSGPDTVGEWLAYTADLYAPHAGLRYLDRHEKPAWFPWAAVRERAARAAAAMAAVGIGPGDFVALILPTAPSFGDAWFGCHLLGAVPVALYPPVRLGRLDEYHEKTSRMLASVQAKLLITEARIDRLLGQTLVRYRPRYGVMVDTAWARTPPRSGGTVRQPDDLAMVQFSSGTTVDPKPVGLTHRQILAQTAALLAEIRATGPADTRAGVSWLPLYHDMGLIGCILPALLNPGPLTLVPPEVFLARPAVWLRALSQYRGTVSPAPDFAYNLCVERVRDDEIEGIDLSSWSMALNGAEPVRATTLQAFADRFGRYGLDPRALTPVYGLSEASLAVTFDAVETRWHTVSVDRQALAGGRVELIEGGLPIVSVGRPVAGFQVEIRDPEGVVLPERRVGRIFAQGPSIMAGYLGWSEQPLRDGWLDTGDLGFVEGDRLYIAGRAKDVIILRGQNHAPHEIEAAVDGVAGVRTGCAVAVADVQEDGEHLMLFVEVREPRPGQADEIRGAVLAATGLAADGVITLSPGTLPRTSSGKLRRAETLRLFHAGALTPPDRVNTWTIAGAFAKSALGRLGWVMGDDG